MSAREEILARVSAALADRPLVEEPRPRNEGVASRDPVGTEAAASDSTLLDLFAERVEDYRAVVERCTTADVAATVAAALDGASVVVPAALGIEVPDAIVDDGTLDAATLDDLDAVVTRARVGIAETGTIVLDHTPDQGRRILSLVPDLHVCIVEAGQVVADVPDAVALLDPARPLTWISGPSATSDIELSRVEGVHGPRTLRVLLVTGD